MAKVIKYVLRTRVNNGTEKEPDIIETLSTITMGWSEANEEIAKSEAYNGEYIIEDDGVEESVVATTEERIDALEEAMLEVLGVVMKND